MTGLDLQKLKKVGRTATCVKNKRMQLGVAAFFVRWTRAEIALLGTDTDSNVARLLGRTEEAVTAEMRQLRVAARLQVSKMLLKLRPVHAFERLFGGRDQSLPGPVRGRRP
jgi:hypothetical protein